MVSDPAEKQSLQPPSISPNRPWRIVLGLQCKATVLIVGVAMGTSLAASLFLFGATTNLFEAQHAEETLSLAETSGLAVAPYLAPPDMARLKSLTQELVQRDPILAMRVYDRNGQPLIAATRDNRWLPDVTIPWQLGASNTPIGVSQFYPAKAEHPAFAGVVLPVRRVNGSFSGAGDASGGADQLVGYLHVATSIERWHLWSRQTLNLLTGVGLVVLLTAIPISYLLVRRMVRPIRDLCEAMVAFASGYMSVRSRVRCRDEVGQLAATFNMMADQHQRAHDSLLKLNNELEKRVARRTRLLRHMATRDSLTGLYNRRYFDEMLQRRFAEARRYGHQLACLMIDMDDFKAVNDALGHTEGDQRLIMLAGVIRRQMRVSDVAARYGGDEFVILLPHTDRHQGRTLAGRILQEFGLCQERDRLERPVSLSIGIADLTDLQPCQPIRLVQAADQALYEAKRSGKNGLCTPAPTTPSSADSMPCPTS